MIREDFLMRLIRQATEAIARMIRKRDDGEYDAAQRDADGAYDLLGIPRELCDVVDTPTLAGPSYVGRRLGIKNLRDVP